MDDSLRLPLGHQEGAPLGEGRRSASAWNDPYTSSKGPKVEQNTSFDLEFGSSTKFEDPELRMDEFARGDGLHDAGSWSRFSPTTAALPNHGSHTFRSNNLSVSPETSETTTPPSGPGPFDHALRGPNINEGLMFPPGEGFGSDADEFWNRRMEEYEGKPVENHDSLHLPYPTLDANLSAPATLPPLRSLPVLGHGFPFSPNAPPYGAQLPSYMSSSMHQVSPGKDHSSPPPTTASTSSSGSSTPFVGTNMFDNNPAGWRGFASGAPDPSYYEWNMGTCDPRGITAQKYELAALHDAEQTLLMPMSSPPPFSSPAPSDASATSEQQEGVIKRVRGRPRKSEPAVDVSYAPTAVESVIPYRTKKKAGEETAGMSLEDVDELTLQFTSRQDAKPTRTLRRQCFNCRTWRDVSAWRRSVMEVGHIVCNKCGLYEKAHKKARPLNERGEFVRPGKHAPKAGARGVVGRVRPKSRGSAESVAGVGVMKFETSGDITK